jgi:hypothetical protein
MSRKPLQFLGPVADNWEMALGGLSRGDEPQDRSASEGPAHDLSVREPFLRRVLAEFEAGQIEAYDYTTRVFAINAATSPAEMQAIVDRPPDGSAGDAGSGRARTPDAVDLARLRSTSLSEPNSPTTRYVTLAIVFVMFAVLIALGMWLATHVHAAALSSGTSGGRRLALMTPRWR